jgi:DNA repair protein RecO (recombination protein O)
MIVTTRGIVLHSVKYSETSLIIKIFTEDYGLRSYIIKGVRSKHSKIKPALFQPLNLLDITVYNRDNKNINHLKEVKLAYNYNNVPYDVVKRSMFLFIDEILYKSLKEETSDKTLFKWLWQSFKWCDIYEKDVLNFHLVFLMQLTKFLGFYPNHPVTGNFKYFDLIEGVYKYDEPAHPHYITGELTQMFKKISETSFNIISSLILTNSQRAKLLNVLISYYELHIEGFGNIKSLDVFRDVF